MEGLKDLFNKEKESLDTLPVPEEMEFRLQKGLKRARPPRKKRGIIAAAVILLLFFSYNYNAIAYYGKKLIGYDEVMNGAIKDLNELGKGQEINKSVTFTNGVIVTLNGIMFDDNRLIAFFSVEDKRGYIDDLNLFPVEMKGIRTYHPTSGQGIHNEDKTEIKWMQNFEPPAFYERTLTFQFSLSDKSKFIGEEEISFKLDRSKAMGHSIKQNINKSISIEGYKVIFNSIQASPTMTMVEGTLLMPEETRQNLKTSRNFRIGLDYDLIANGQEVTKMGGGLSSSLLGYSFEGRFEPLPEDIKSLQIRLNQLPYSQNIQESVKMDFTTENYLLQAAGNDILLKKLYTKGDFSYLTIETSEDVLLEKIYLLIDGEKISLERTIGGELEKYPDGRITNERTLEFPQKGEKYEVLLERISYTKDYNRVIDIPING